MAEYLALQSCKPADGVGGSPLQRRHGDGGDGGRSALASGAAMALDLLSLTAAELAAAAAAPIGKGAGVAPQLFRAATCAGTFAPEQHGLSAAAAARWRQHFALRLPEVLARIAEPTAAGASTSKWRLGLADGLAVECVHIPLGGYGDGPARRSSLCLSTQVGCARACSFCETGRLGLLRNLTAGEIVGQYARLRQQGLSPTTLVFMGMGEPLDNFAALAQALAVLTDRRGPAFAHERITVCTVGNPTGIDKLAALGQRRLGLNLSLNAADDALRARLMPVARAPLAEVHAALCRYRRRRNLTFGIHWCLLPGINDSRADARAIAAFCRGLGRVLVHVIPFNPGTAPIARAPTADEVARFVDWLRQDGLPVRQRIAKGRSVMAACGQLGAAT